MIGIFDPFSRPPPSWVCGQQDRGACHCAQFTLQKIPIIIYLTFKFQYNMSAGAPLGNKNALGNPGGGSPSAVDRELAKKVRSLTLNKIKDLLELTSMNIDQYELYKAVLIKLAGTVLPRINEGSGDNGEFVFKPIIGTIFKKDNSLPVVTDDQVVDIPITKNDDSKISNEDRPTTGSGEVLE